MLDKPFWLFKKFKLKIMSVLHRIFTSKTYSRELVCNPNSGLFYMSNRMFHTTRVKTKERVSNVQTDNSRQACFNYNPLPLLEDQIISKSTNLRARQLPFLAIIGSLTKISGLVVLGFSRKVYLF